MVWVVPIPHLSNIFIDPVLWLGLAQNSFIDAEALHPRMGHVLLVITPPSKAREIMYLVASIRLFVCLFVGALLF